MKVYGVSEWDLKCIAAKVLVSVDTTNHGSYVRCKVNPLKVDGINRWQASTGPRLGDQVWDAAAGGYTWTWKEPRKVHAVCWHGFRAFLDLLFLRFPHARVVSACADYNGRAAFLYTYAATGEQNVGSVILPVCREDKCFCGDRGTECYICRNFYPARLLENGECPVCREMWDRRS